MLGKHRRVRESKSFKNVIRVALRENYGEIGKALVNLSRMESGQMPFHMVRVDLAEYTAAYVAHVRRVFDNLLENSEKYAGVCPVRVDIFIREDEGGILLEWKDNGQGVADEKLSRIFDRFYRCDEARQEKGSGVGLYVVKYIMERHHGWVTAPR